MHVERLRQLEVLMREVAAHEVKRKHFNLTGWVGRVSQFGTITDAQVSEMLADGVPMKRKNDGCVEVDPMVCGYSACAIGWAGSNPGFIAQGFCLLKGEYTRALAPVYHATGAQGWGAVTDFFEIDFESAFHLFMAERYERDNGPLAVAERISELIAGQA